MAVSSQTATAALGGAAAGAKLGGTVGTFVAGPAGTAVGAGIGAAGGAAIAAYPTLKKTQTEKLQQEQLDELLRRQQMGALGLTEQEEEMIRRDMELQFQDQRRQAAALQGQYLASSGMTGAGDMQRLAVAQQDIEAQARLELEAAILKSDLVKKQQEETKIAALTAALDERSAEKAAAVSAITQQGIAGVNEGIAHSQLTSPSNVQNVALAYGISEEQAAAQMQLMQQNPELAALMATTAGET